MGRIVKGWPPLLADGRERSVILLVAFALGQSAAVGAAAFATRDVFAALRDGGALPVVALSIIALGAGAIGGLRYCERIVAERLGQRYAAAVRIAVFEHLSRVSARSVAARRVGELSLRFVGDLAAVRGWVSRGVASLVSAAVVLPVSLGVLIALDPRLALAAGIPFSMGVLAMTIAGPGLGPAHRRLRARRARLAADMTERVVHAPELRLLGRIGIEREHLAARTDSMVEAAVARARGLALLRAIPDALAGIVAASVFATALLTGVSGAVTAGALAAVGLALQHLRELAGVWDRHRAFVAARDKCEKLLTTPRLRTARTIKGSGLPDAPQALRFEAVSAAGLQDIDATAEAGRHIAVVGRNGAGKSTLLALAAGLEHCSSGRVTFGDRDIAGLGTKERRQLITLVTGRSPILAGTVRRSLSMGAPERPDDRVLLAAAERYGIAAAIERLGGLDGKVAEGARNLSAGEARRLLLARAALSRPRLLLLDEPDDALDADAHRLVCQLLDDVEATALVVTHDSELARMLDATWLLEGGWLMAGESRRDVVA